MKEMIYQHPSVKEILEDAKKDKYRYLVVSYGSHPCGYVGVTKEHPAYGKHYDDIDIDVHGGLTYSEAQILGIQEPDVWWLGWDYAHWGDYSYYGENFERCFPYDGQEKKYTTQEIITECLDVISQLEKMEK